MPYQIKKWTDDAVIHEFGDSEKECLENGVANGVCFDYAELNYAELNYAELNDAELNYAKLNYAKLNYAKLNYAELNYAKLNDAELNGAELNDAELHSIKYEFFGKLALQFNEIGGLRQAIIDGKIDGSQYSGDCACFVGTIANVAHISIENLVVEKKADSLTEIWFLAIRKGDTPETNPFAKITVEWIDEFLAKTSIPKVLKVAEEK